MWGRRKKRRKRRGYVRPSRARPKTGWSLVQLAQLSGTSARTIRLYVQRDLIPRPPFAGSATRYQRRQLTWLCAVRRLRADEKLGLAAIRTRLHALAASELEALATRDLPAGKLAEALGMSSPTPQHASVHSPPPRGSAELSHGTRWKRVELALGLELHVREDASERVMDLVKRVREACDVGC